MLNLKVKDLHGDNVPVMPEAAVVQSLQLQPIGDNRPEIDILRLDLVHPVISGNKWYKLKYHVEEAIRGGFSEVVTYGGAWSNHIIATACMAKQAGLRSIGIIRGEAPVTLSETLRKAMEYGMQLQFLDRQTFAKEADVITENDASNNQYRIPQGGAGAAGIAGSKEILKSVDTNKYTHIICCIGTGTMLSGIVQCLLPQQSLLGIVVLKGFQAENFRESIQGYLHHGLSNVEILTGYHYGGYAKRSRELIAGMNLFYKETGVPTDFVYTGKMVCAAMDLISKNFFPRESSLLLIHSGGLQGNISLPSGTLIY